MSRLRAAASGIRFYIVKLPASRWRDSLKILSPLTGHEEPEHVSLEDHQDGHHDREPDGPLQDQAQEVALLALQSGGARAHGEVLRRDHLTQHASRGVGADG